MTMTTQIAIAPFQREIEIDREKERERERGEREREKEREILYECKSMVDWLTAMVFSKFRNLVFTNHS